MSFYLYLLKIGYGSSDLQLDLSVLTPVLIDSHHYCLVAIMWQNVHIMASLLLSFSACYFMYLISFIQLQTGCNFKLGQLMSNFQSSHCIWTLLARPLYRSFTLGLWRPYVFVF